MPALWWDWLAISRECDERPQKYIPVGMGRYHSDQIPAFVRGAAYLNLSDDGAIDALLRRIRQVWRERVPRRGVFISYAHRDDKSWLDNLLVHLSWLKRQHGVEFWTDRDIEPGEKWHDMIQCALDGAKDTTCVAGLSFILLHHEQRVASNARSRRERGAENILDSAASIGLQAQHDR